MANTNRVDQSLFSDTHYLGKPADDSDRIIARRIHVLNQFPAFFDKKASLLEIGCGGGATITRLANRFRLSLGIDLFDYKEAFEINRKRYQSPSCTFRQLDLESTTLNETFDRIISFEVIEHFQNEDSVASFATMLNSGGYMAISVPNKWWIFETHGAKLPGLPWNRVPFFSWLPTPIHERYANARIYTQTRIIKLLEKHGFDVLDTRYITAPMDVLKEGRLKRWLTSTIFKNDTTKIPFLSTSIFVMAQKR